jgi:tetratricopeptide (TPR) repeat protein
MASEASNRSPSKPNRSRVGLSNRGMRSGGFALLGVLAVWPCRAGAQEACLPEDLAARLEACPADAAPPDRDALARAVAAMASQDRSVAPSDFRPRRLSDPQSRLAALLQQVSCAPSSPPEDRVAAAYRRARLYYEANRFVEAAILFRAIARRNADSDLAEFAVNLYLDCLNVLGSRSEPARPECLDRLAAEVPVLRGQYCGSAAPTVRDELCDGLLRLECQARRRQAERASSAGGRRGAAETLLRLAEELPQCERMDEILWNAAEALAADRDAVLAIEVRERLVAAHPVSALAARALFLNASAHHAMADYDRAAAAFETFARRYPGQTIDGTGAQNITGRCDEEDRRRGLCPDAPSALENAAILRAGLGQVDLALADVRLFERNYAVRRRLETARLVLGAGAVLEGAGRLGEAVRHYAAWLAHYGDTDADLVLAAHVSLARCAARTGDRTRSEAEARGAADLWRSEALRLFREPVRGDADDETWSRRATVREAAAEALFLLATRRIEQAPAVPRPAYRGAGRRQDLDEWAREDLQRWRHEAAVRLAAARDRLAPVAELEVPRWTIAALARLGDLARSAEPALREPAVPVPLRRDPALAELYRSQARQDADSLRARALELYGRCLETATGFRWFDETVAHCARALEELDPQQHRAASEIWAPPTWSPTTWVEPPAAL